MFLKHRLAKRVISLVLVMIMVLSSVSSTFAASQANAQSNLATNNTATSGNVANKSNGLNTGYKVELLFLPVPELTTNSTKEEREEMIAKAWDEAEENPEKVRHIGDVIYLTNPNTNGYSINVGFPYSDFTYGLGTGKGTMSRTNSSGQPDLKSIGTDRVRTPAQINSVTTSLATKNSYPATAMSMDSLIPILMGDSSIIVKKDMKYFLMHDRTAEEKEQDKDVDGQCYATNNFASLVNYLATIGGTEPNSFIYFARLTDTSGAVNKYDELIPDNANCFEAGRYKGVYGEYRLQVSTYYGIHIAVMGGAPAALTLRDLAYFYSDCSEVYRKITTEQYIYYDDLAYSLCLSDDDIWDLKSTSRDDWEGKRENKITANIRQNLGGGIGFFTSSQMHMIPEGEPNYIGSISHIFLPGVLGEEQDEVEGIGLEYIGPKTDTVSTSLAMEKAALSIAKALVGEEQKAGDIPFNSSISSSDTGVILNGTIKLPGLSEGTANTFDGTYGNAERYAKELVKILDGNATGEGALKIDDTTREAIKEVIKEEFGIDLESMSSGTLNTSAANMTDLALAVYLLSHYQIDGYDTDGRGYGGVDNGNNRWKQEFQNSKEPIGRELREDTLECYSCLFIAI